MAHANRALQEDGAMNQQHREKMLAIFVRKAQQPVKVELKMRASVSSQSRNNLCSAHQALCA